LIWINAITAPGAASSDPDMRLEKWCVISRNSPSLQSPEQERGYLHGFVTGHPHCPDGKEVITSRIVSRKADHVVTKSGSEYELGEVDPFYGLLFPNARERLLAGLRNAQALPPKTYEI
jgi:hypothetical protein